MTSNKNLSGKFDVANQVTVYGTPGNQYGDTIVGGEDFKIVHKMLEDAIASGIAGSGDDVISKIGEFKGRDVYEQKAVDQIRISLDDDGQAYVKLIVRDLDPGKGMIAPAGGFKDEGESDEQAADREENEEAKSKAGELIERHTIARRPVTGDARVWGGPDRADGVKNGDIIMMTTAAMVPVVKNAHGAVEKGDDAKYAGWVKLSDLDDANVFGVKAHAQLVLEAVSIAGLSDQLPASFAETLAQRTVEVQIASPEAQEHSALLLSNDIA